MIDIMKCLSILISELIAVGLRRNIPVSRRLLRWMSRTGRGFQLPLPISRNTLPCVAVCQGDSETLSRVWGEGIWVCSGEYGSDSVEKACRAGNSVKGIRKEQPVYTTCHIHCEPQLSQAQLNLQNIKHNPHYRQSIENSSYAPNIYPNSILYTHIIQYL